MESKEVDGYDGTTESNIILNYYSTCETATIGFEEKMTREERNKCHAQHAQHAHS